MRHKKIGFIMVLAAFFAAGVLFIACEVPDVDLKLPETDRPGGGGGGGEGYDNPGSTTPAPTTKTVGSIAEVSSQLSGIAPRSTTTFLVPVTGTAETQTFSTAANSNLEGSTIIIQGSGTPAALMAAKPFRPLSALTRNEVEAAETTGVIQFIGGTGAMFTVEGNITLIFKNIVLEGIEGNTSALVVAQQSSTIKLRAGSVITGNTNTGGKGGGVWVTGGAFVMEGGSVKGNAVSSNEGAGYGGGVYVESGLFTLTSGTISKNMVSGNDEANGFGGGVYVSEKGFFDKTGGAINGTGADENTATGGGSAIAIKELGKEIESINETVTAAKKTGNVGATLATQLETIKEKGKANETYSVIVTKDETLEPQTLSDGRLSGATIIIRSSIRGTPRRVTLSGAGALFNISDNNKLVLQDIILVGVNNNTSALVVISDNGTLEMLSGSKITGNTNNTADNAGYGSSKYGGGVGVFEGTLKMSGNAEISGNMVYSNGGGVYVNNGGTFEMAGNAVISGNNASGNGGGVYDGADSGFSMADAAVIKGNTAGSNGGGVYTAIGFSMADAAVIKGNTAGSNGGGVYTAIGFSMADTAVISGNKATGNGGGVYAAGDSFLMLDTAVISGNTATGNGGGIYAAIDFSMSGNAVISGNKAEYGGGIYANGSFSMSGTAVISGNTAYSNGGGVYANGSFEMEDAVISGNRAYSSNGGGVYAVGSFSMSGTAVISGNNARSNGGGVYANGSFEMEDAVISENRAENGGGVYAAGSFEMKDGAVIKGNNTKAGSGGGVYAAGDFGMTDTAVISGNSADSNGGGVYVAAGGFGMSGTAVVKGNTVKGFGGGVYAAGDFSMSGNAVISGNNASGNGSGNGGGVYAAGNFSMADTAVISGNSAKDGGGVYAAGGFSKTGGTIYGSDESDSLLKNTARTGGQAVLYTPNGTQSYVRNTTAGTDVNLSTDNLTTEGGWEQ